MVINVQNDTNGSIEDTLILTTSAGSVIVDAGNYSSSQQPTTANKATTNPIIINPNGGGLAINKTTVTSG
jgi:hypothetical protein